MVKENNNPVFRLYPSEQEEEEEEEFTASGNDF